MARRISKPYLARLGSGAPPSFRLGDDRRWPEFNHSRSSNMRFVLAYLDAGTGSLIVQLLVGGLAGVAALTRFRWATVKRWLRRDEKV